MKYRIKEEVYKDRSEYIPQCSHFGIWWSGFYSSYDEKASFYTIKEADEFIRGQKNREYKETLIHHAK